MCGSYHDVLLRGLRKQCVQNIWSRFYMDKHLACNDQLLHFSTSGEIRFYTHVLKVGRQEFQCSPIIIVITVS